MYALFVLYLTTCLLWIILATWKSTGERKMTSGYYFIKLATNVAIPMYVICLDNRMYIWQNGKQQWLQLNKEQIVSERLTYEGEK